MRGEQDGAARRLVHAARLHADEAVLDQIEPADAVALAELVELRQQRRRRQLLAVDRDRVARLEIDRDDGRLVGRGLPDRRCANRRSRALPAPGLPAPCLRTRRAAGWRRPRTARRRACPWRSGSGASRRTRSAACASVRSHSRHGAITVDVGLERVIGQLEADLVVALAGRAMRHRVGADLLGDLDLLLGDQRPRDRGAEQILALVDACWRGTSGTRSRARIPRAGPR